MWPGPLHHTKPSEFSALLWLSWNSEFCLWTCVLSTKSDGTAEHVLRTQSCYRMDSLLLLSISRILGPVCPPHSYLHHMAFATFQGGDRIIVVGVETEFHHHWLSQWGSAWGHGAAWGLACVWWPWLSWSALASLWFVLWASHWQSLAYPWSRYLTCAVILRGCYTCLPRVEVVGLSLPTPEQRPTISILHQFLQIM